MMKNRILLIYCLSLFMAKAGAQVEESVQIHGKELTMPLEIQKSYGAWTSVETKSIMSTSELNTRLKNTEKMESAKEYEKDPKLALQKANIVLLKAKNANLGITLYYYSYFNIPNYLSLSASEMSDIWLSKLKPNPKTLLNLSDGNYAAFSFYKGEGTIEGKPVSFFFRSSTADSGFNEVLIYTVSKQNAPKGVKFFGETFGLDWDSGQSLDEGHW